MQQKESRINLNDFAATFLYAHLLGAQTDLDQIYGSSDKNIDNVCHKKVYTDDFGNMINTSLITMVPNLSDKSFSFPCKFEDFGLSEDGLE